MPADFSRRRFLTVASAAAAGATFLELPPVLRSARAAEKGASKDGDKPYGDWPVGIQSYTLRNFKVDDALRHVEGLGLHYIEFFGAHFSTGSTAEQIKQMHATLSKAKIKISAHGVNGFTKNHDANRRLFEFARQAGFKNLTADPTPDSFDSLDKLCAEFDIRIAIHNHGPGHRYATLANLQKAVKDRHKNIGACVDTGHVLRSDEDPVKWVHELGDRVFALHLKDVNERKDKTFDVVIGSKHLDLVGIFKGLKKIKFPADGSISLEYESHPQNPIDDVKQCLVAAQQAIAKAAAG